MVTPWAVPALRRTKPESESYRAKYDGRAGEGTFELKMCRCWLMPSICGFWLTIKGVGKCTGNINVLSHPGILIYVGMSRYVRASMGNLRRSFRNAAVNAPCPSVSRANSDSPHAAMRTWDSRETERGWFSGSNSWIDGSSSTERTRVKASLLVPEPE